MREDEGWLYIFQINRVEWHLETATTFIFCARYPIHPVIQVKIEFSIEP